MTYWQMFQNVCTVIVIIQLWCIFAGWVAYRLFQFAGDEK